MKTCSIVNVVESTIARNSDWVLPIHAGPEIGVASTKAFLGQLIVLYILSLKLSIVRGDVDKKSYDKNVENLQKLPESIKNTLKLESEIHRSGIDFHRHHALRDSIQMLRRGQLRIFAVVGEFW